MHESVMTWVGEKVDAYALAWRAVLECGSRNVNGSVRGLFRGPYVGIDMEEGVGVDVVASASSIPFSAGFFEVVVCTEMLEHDPAPWLSLPEMSRVLVPRGLLLLTTRGIGFELHEWPSDYWRFTPAGVSVLLALAGLEEVEVVDDPEVSGVFALARKPVFPQVGDKSVDGLQSS